MFQTIQGIDIGQGSGVAFGGGIYNASCEIGFSNGPTRINLSVVASGDNFTPFSINTNTEQYDINFYGQIFSGMYLTSYKKEKSPSATLLQLNFLDSSINLDRIYIGLLNRHGNTYRESVKKTGVFSVRCQRCDNGAMATISGQAFRYIDIIPINSGCYFERNEDGHGYIILGQESFPDTNCEIPKVDYNFSELCHALSQFGIAHNLSGFDINKNYRQEYVGSLREVLNAWGSDFGFEFFYHGNGISGIDLRKPINLSGLKELAETNEYITEYSYEESLENSYSQSIISRYMKPSRTKEYRNPYFYRRIGYQIFLDDIIGNGLSAGRNALTTKISVALSKFDPVLRDSFIASTAMINKNYDMLQALGFTYVSMAPDVAAAQILNMTKLQLNNIEFGTGLFNPDNYWVVLGYYRPEIKEKVQEWDTNAADFIGKYYYFDAAVPNNQFNCPISNDGYSYYTYDSKWETLPESTIYGYNAVPFQNLLQNPVTQTNLSYNGIINNRNIFEINDNSWGIQQSEYDAIKNNIQYSHIAETTILTSDDAVVPAELFLSKLENRAPTDNNFINLYKTTLEAETTIGAKAAVMIIPKLNTNNSNFPSISLAMGLIFNNEAYNRLREKDTVEERVAACKTFCDFDIVSDICNCGTQYSPTPYFKDLLAPYFNILHTNGNISRIIFPVSAPYWGFLKNDRYFKTTYPPIKSIYGKPNVARNNTIASRVIDYDITPDLDATFDDNNNINENIYTTAGQITTAQEYHRTLSNIGDIVVPPQETLSFSTARSDLDALEIPLSPASGLVSFSISMGADGAVTNLSYASRPPFLPKPDVVFSKIKYRLK